MGHYNRYIGQRNGAPLVSWGQAAPSQARASDSRSLGNYQGYGAYEDFPGGQLINVDGQPARQAMGCGCSSMGSLSEHSLEKPVFKMPLPRTGAPESLPSFGAVMQSDGGFGSVVDSFNAMPPFTKVAILAGAFFVGKKLLKKKK